MNQSLVNPSKCDMFDSDAFARDHLPRTIHFGNVQMCEAMKFNSCDARRLTIKIFTYIRLQSFL